MLSITIDSQNQSLNSEIHALRLKKTMLESEKLKKMKTINQKALESEEIDEEDKKRLQQEMEAVEQLRSELNKEQTKEPRRQKKEEKKEMRHSLNLTFRKKKGTSNPMATQQIHKSKRVSESENEISSKGIIEYIKEKKEKKEWNKEEIIENLIEKINKLHTEEITMKTSGIIKNVDEDVIVQQKSNTKFFVQTKLVPKFDEITSDVESDRLGEEKIKKYDEFISKTCEDCAVVASVVIDTLSLASLAVANPEIKEYQNQFQSAAEAILVKINKLIDSVLVLFEKYIEICECSDDKMKNYIDTHKATLQLINKIKLEPEVNESIIKASKGEGQPIKAGFIEGDFYESGEGLSSLVCQLIITVGNIVRNKICKMEEIIKKKKKDKNDDENPFVLTNRDLVKFSFVEFDGVCVSLVQSLKMYVCKVFTAVEVRKTQINQEKLQMGSCNLWEEIQSGKKKIIYKDGTTDIKEASLNRIIESLTSLQLPKRDFQTTFFFSFPSFTKAKEIIDALITRYNIPEGVEASQAGLIKKRVVVTLNYFCKLASDECNENLLNYILQFINNNQDDSQLKSIKSMIDKRLEERNKLISNYFIPPVDLLLPQDMCSPALFISKMDDLEIAKQLTMVDYTIYKNVRETELFDCAFDKMKYRAPNVCKMLSRVDELSHWIGSMILCFADVEMRARMMNKLISVAEQLLHLQNFHALAGFYVGLEGYSPISRLNQTKALLTPQSIKTMKVLDSYYNLSNSNYKAYRNYIKNAKIPCVPFIAVVTKDLTFTTDGNETFIKHDEDKYINFEKQEMIYSQIEEFLRFRKDDAQESTYKFPIVQPLYNYLKQLNSLPEELLYKISIAVEPRVKK